MLEATLNIHVNEWGTANHINERYAEEIKIDAKK